MVANGLGSAWAMRGTYRGEERAQISEIWKREQIPHFISDEVGPLSTLLDGKTNLVAVDVGANKGFWTKAFLELHGDRTQHVYMIDASEENFRELTNKEDNLLLDRDDFPKISAFHFAVGENSGKIKLYTNEDGSPLASVHRKERDAGFNLAAQTASFLVPLDTIDNFVRKHNIQHVDVLKIDTEGNELNVLNGAVESFDRGMIDIVVFEFGMHQIEPRHFFKDFFFFFSDRGFDIFSLKSQALFPIPNYHCSLEVFSNVFNFAAARRAR
jgi:FkbM family methyltransferase